MKDRKNSSLLRRLGEVPAGFLRCFVIRIGVGGLCTEQNRSILSPAKTGESVIQCQCGGESATNGYYY